MFSVLALFSFAPTEKAGATPPNILLILADDLGYADIAAYGYANDIATPHIDQLAANGTRFTHGYATHPFCSPSRAGLMAGMYQHRFGFETNSGPELYASPNFGLPKHVPTLAEKLNTAGYATGMIGKWHIGFREGLRPHERGFDSFYGFLSGARSFYPDPNGNSPLLRNDTVIKKEPAYLTDAFADEAAAFIQENQDQPWFLYLAFNAVHTPMEATDEYEARFPHITDPKRRTLAGMLAAMDDAVGRVMQEVRATNAENNTLVLFYSDNGGIPPKNASLNGPLRGMKGATYEGGIRVPFIAQWKGTIPEGLVYEHPVMGFDCHATALAAAGLPLDNGNAPALDGVNLIPFLTGKEVAPPHKELVWRADKQQGLRTGKWKMVKQAREDPQLFNLDADPGETNNLANTHPEKLAQLTNAFDKWSTQMMDPQWIRQDRDNAEPGGKLKEVAETRNRRSPSTAQLREVFPRADQNNDGKLTREEYPRPENFPQVDTNDDGVVTLEEVRVRFTDQNRRRVQRDTLPQQPPTPSPPSAASPAPRFELHQQVDLSDGPIAAAAFDANADGWDDLALAAGNTSGKFILALNTPADDATRTFTFDTLPMSTDAEHNRTQRVSKSLGLHDFNKDGLMDLYLGNGGPGTLSLAPDGKTIRRNLANRSSANSIQINNGDGTFTTRDLGVDSRGSNIRSVVFADFDGDGHTDSYHSVSPYYGPGWGGSPHGNELHPGTGKIPPFGEDVIVDSLPNPGFWQDEHGRAVKMTKATLVRDLDNDDKPDLVTGAYADIWGGSFRRLQTPEDAELDLDEDGIPDTTWPGYWERGLFLLHNVSTPGAIRFKNVSNAAVENASSYGTDYPQMHVYSILAADIDHDADLDLFVTGPRNVSAHRSVEDNTPTARLLRNDSTPGNIAFTDITADAGLAFLNNDAIPAYPLRRGVPNLAAGAAIDVNNDSHIDFVLVDRQDGNPRAPIAPWIFLNDGKGRFQAQPQDEHGLSGNLNDLTYTDLDQDGKLDLVFVNGDPQGGGHVKIYRNTTENENQWLALTVETPDNPFGLESKVTVRKASSDEVLGYDELRTDFCYRSKRAPSLHFGLGETRSVDIEVTTRNGYSQTFENLPAGKIHRLTIDGNKATDPILGQTLADWFTSFDKNNDRFITTDEMDARSLRGGDRNADRRISRTEAQRYFGDLQATAAARANPDIYVPWSKTENQTRLRRAKSGDPLLNLDFSRDLPTGEKDPNGNLITGTECLHLEGHNGMLFATLSGWNHDKTRAPWPGASVAVKKSADAPWEIEQNFGKDSGRAGSLHSVSFNTLADGEKLDAPAPILLCGIGGRSDAGKIVVWARNNATGNWVKTIAGEHGGPASPEVRVLFDHVDSVTGIHHVFAAASNGMLFRGAYHPAVEGKILWHPEPELSGRDRRFMGAAEVDGTVYITIDLEPTNPENGGLFKRIDGENPRWERVTGWQWSHPNPHHLRPWFGMRGLTALGDGTLLGAREHPGAIDRIHPDAPAKERNTVEFDVRSALLDTWDHPPENPGGMAIIAYNDMLPLTHPTTGQETHLISLGTRHPEGGTLRDPNPLGASAWYLVRYNATQYGLGRIPHPGDGTLRATRTICASPFPEEKNRVWYFAGFDAFGGPSHLNTAWIARGELPDN
ncbi:MAG: sulfatase-like hydrolase/transferase [Verrucomicrobiota bacterium]